MHYSYSVDREGRVTSHRNENRILFFSFFHRVRKARESGTLRSFCICTHELGESIHSGKSRLGQSWGQWLSHPVIHFPLQSQSALNLYERFAHFKADEKSPKFASILPIECLPWLFILRFFLSPIFGSRFRGSN